MAYVKIKHRNLKFVKVAFMAKNIKETQIVREDRIERFRENMLLKHNFLFKKEPHIIVEYFE